jgi:hypothetical protein
MTPKETRIAAVILTLVAASGALLFQGMRMDDGAERFGPMRTFAAGGQAYVALFHGNQLHVIDAAGRRLARQPLADLQLTDEPTDMDWTVDAGGKVEAWFFEDTLPRVVRCELAAAGTRLERCATAAKGPQLKSNDRSRAVHLAVDIERRRMFIADASGHAVRAFTLEGRQLAESVKGDLFFPNRLRIAGDALMVADNDHRRLAWLDIAADKPSFTLRKSVRSDSHPQVRGDRARVADFALLPDAQGEPTVLWMLAVAQGQKKGDVLVWGPGMKAAARADLGGFGDPLFIDRWGDGAIAADFDGVALYRLGAKGEYQGEFGDPAFQQELRDSRDRIAGAVRWTRAGWASFAATLVIGFLLAWKFGEKPGQKALAAAFAGMSDVTADIPRAKLELKPLPWFGRQQALAAGIGLLAVLALPVAAFLLFPHELPPSIWQSPKLLKLIPLVALVWIGMGAAFWWTTRMAQRRIVLAKGTAQIRLGANVVASAPVLEVIASPQALLIGGVMLPYRGIAWTGGKPGRWIYEEDPLTRYLLAHLPASQRLTQPALARAAMKRMAPWKMVALGLPLAAYVAFQAWRVFGG